MAKPDPSEIPKTKTSEESASTPKHNRRKFIGAVSLMVFGGLLDRTITTLDGFTRLSGIKHESLKDFMAAHGMTDYTVIDEEMSPEKYKVFKDSYEKLLALLPENVKSGLKIPILVAYKSDENNGYYMPDPSIIRETNVIAISQLYYEKNSKQDELVSVYQHELGHWLCAHNRTAAENISGFLAPEVQPILKKMRARIEALGKSKRFTDEKYQQCCDELIADGIYARLSHSATAGISDLANIAQHNDSLAVSSELRFYEMRTKEKDSLANQLMNIRKTIRRDGIAEHPADDIRDEYMTCVAKLYGHSLPGRGR